MLTSFACTACRRMGPSVAGLPLCLGPTDLGAIWRCKDRFLDDGVVEKQAISALAV